MKWLLLAALLLLIALGLWGLWRTQTSLDSPLSPSIVQTAVTLSVPEISAVPLAPVALEAHTPGLLFSLRESQLKDHGSTPLTREA